MKWVFLTVMLISNLTFAQKQVAYLSTDQQVEDITSYVTTPYQEVPFLLLNGMILVKASINHQSGYFILDTGAPMLVLNQSRYRDVHTLSNAAGCSGEFSIGESTVRHFSWAGIDKYELKVLTTDLSHLEVATGRKIQGLIGYNLLSNQELFIDYKHQRLILFPQGQNLLHRALTPVYSASLDMRGHLPVIEFDMGNKTFRFGLDTGSEGNLIDACKIASLDEALIDTIKKEEIQGLDKKIRTVPVVRIRQSSWNELPMHQLQYLVTDLCHLNSSDTPSLDGLLGYAFLGSMKLSINYQEGKFYLWEGVSQL